MNQAGRTVISLGGSLFVPDEVDVTFLRGFMEIIRKRIAEGERFAIILGGGKTCRKYQQAGRDLGLVSKADIDWIGIEVNNMHADFMRIVNSDIAYEKTVTNPTVPVTTDKPVVFVGAYEPGHSSDMDAVQMAQTLGAKKVMNLSNTNYVYDKDPKTNPDAKPLMLLGWEQYRALIPSEWQPGLNTPFDPSAAKAAQELGLEVMIINGTKLEEVEKCLKGEPFDGTVIKD